VPGNNLATVLREPAGVVGQITPWNFPLYVGAWKFAPALCSGCSVVLKPSELTSLTMLAAAELALAAGVPAGVFNVVCGTGPAAGAALAAHPDVDVLAFTGGTETGRKVLHARADRLRPTQLELGGKSPNIVFDDADLEQAAAGAAFGIFYNQGENCNAGSRLLVHAKHSRCIRRAAWSRGPGRSACCRRSTSARRWARSSRRRTPDKVAGYVDLGVSEGATLLCGGPPPPDAHFNQGHWYLPTVLAGVTREHRVFPGGDLRAGRDCHKIRGRRRGDRAGQRDRVRAGRGRLDDERAAGPALRPGAAVRLCVDQQLQPDAGRGAVRRREVVRLRPRLRAAGGRHVHDLEDGAVVAGRFEDWYSQ
jgi:acyl-CoA reductase-like NAD-dependent aldehyde dehydrogenase